MSDSKHDPNRYAVTLSDGRTYTYGADGQERFPWRIGQDCYNAHICRTPADYRACAEVVERWEADHAPRVRRRVVEYCGDWYAVSLCGGIVYSNSEASVRRLLEQGVEDFHATDVAEDIARGKLYADLAARPDEEYSDE